MNTDPRRSALLVTALVASAGCSVVDPIACTDEARPGITVTVQDSITGGSVGGGGLIKATDGFYLSEAATFAGIDSYGLAFERAGTYTVTVQQPNYQTWTRTGVRVTKGQCHVNTVTILARLKQ